MDKNQTKKCRPYLATFRLDDLPVVIDNVKEFKTDLEPTLHNLGNSFSQHKTHKLQHKFCSQICTENKKCTKKCIKEREKRLNDLILVDKVDSRLAPIIKRIERGEDPDTIVIFDDRQCACIGIVLSSYSKFFCLLRNQTVIDMRKVPVAANTFEQIYKWMVQREFQFMPIDAVRIIRAAYFLEMPDLLHQCYAMLDGEMFKEFWAFYIMHTTRSYNELHQINQAMAWRIGKSTLILLCSREFLELNESQICALLRSNSLCVNSESELFYGALHWLDEDWPSRSKCVTNVLKNIRFSYLSPKILCQLNGLDQSGIGPFNRVLSEFSQAQEMKKLVEDGIFYSTLVITTGGDSSKIKQFPTARQEMMVPRHWIMDSRCSYHRPVTKLCPNMRSIHYEEFAAYADILLETDVDYEPFFLYPDESPNSPQIVKPKKCNQIDTFRDQTAYDPSWSNYLDESDSTSAWDTQSIISWVRSECPTVHPVDIQSVNSIPTGCEDMATPEMLSSADEATVEWRKRLKDFVPSEIWEEWEEKLLSKIFHQSE